MSATDRTDARDSQGYARVLVAVDLAMDNSPLLARAQAIAGAGTALVLVHVMEPAYFYYGLAPSFQIGVPATTTGFPEETEEELMRRARRQLEQLGALWDIPESAQHLERGHAATHIIALAEQLDADLVLVGSHGRHGLQLLLGSTANAVLHRAPCDVLAVRVFE